MTLPAKTTSRGKDINRNQQHTTVDVARGAPHQQTTARLEVHRHKRQDAPRTPKKSVQEKARLATFSFTPEDLRYVEKATYQVILALETGVSKSHAVRLAMRVFAHMSVEELRNLLRRVSLSQLDQAKFRA